MNQMNQLERANYLSLGTYRRSGVRVDTPVWFAPDAEGKLYVFSAANAGKVKRLRNSSRADVAVCNIRGKLKGAWRPASARLIDDAAGIEHAYAALYAKYGWLMRMTDFFSRLSGRIHRRAMIEIELTGEGDQSPA